MRMSLLCLALLAALGACGAKPEDSAALDNLDATLAATNGASTAEDPALRAALRDQIMVDPALAQTSNGDAVRPPDKPFSAPIPPEGVAATGKPADVGTLRTAPAASGDCPQCAAARRALTLGALAQQQGRPGDCAARIDYSTVWATRLPAAVPLYPDARVAEAAGADGTGCALRVVSFRSDATVQRLLDFYYTRTADAGYRAQHQADGTEHVLAGTRGAGAFLVVVRPGPNGGSEVDLMADGA